MSLKLCRALWERPSTTDVFFPTKDQSHDNLVTTVGPGVKSSYAAGPATLDIDNDTIKLDFNWWGSWVDTSSDPNGFNGFEIFDLRGLIAPIVGANFTSNTNMAGLDSSRLTFDDNHVWVNWEGLPFDPNTVVEIDITFA